MAKKLDDLLQPRERVLWRDPEPQLRDAWPRILGTAGMGTALMGSLMGRDSLEGWLMSFGIFFAVLMVGEFVLYRVGPWLDGRGETVLTAGRLLHGDARTGGKLVEVPLAEIAEVAVGQMNLLTLVTRDGAATVPTGLRQPQALAAALAAAAGLPPPPLAGRLAGLWEDGKSLGTAACLVPGVVLRPDWILNVYDDLQFGDLAVLMVWALSLLFTASLVGRHVAAVVGLVVLRRRASAAEAHTWLDLATEGQKTESAWSRPITHLMLWRSPFYAWLVRLLWGAPPNGSNAGAARHG